MAEEIRGALELVRHWAAAWNALDWNAVAETFTQDGTNHSMMDEPVIGRDAIRQRTRLIMEGVNEIDVRLANLSLLESGVVVAERVDSCRRADGTWGHVPVAGFYEIEQGLIKAKRDYYDRAQLLNAMLQSADHLSQSMAP